MADARVCWRLLYLVQCHFDYACSMWFRCVSSTSRKRLQIIQNELIRFILGISTRSHISYREFSSSNMLPVEYRVTQLKLNHMFNIVHGSAPEYLKNNINITNIHIIQDQAALHVIFPTLKALALNLFFHRANSGILFLIVYNVSLINLFLRK